MLKDEILNEIIIDENVSFYIYQSREFSETPIKIVAEKFVSSIGRPIETVKFIDNEIYQQEELRQALFESMKKQLSEFEEKNT